MTNGSDPDAVLSPLDRCEDAFEVRGRGEPTWEADIDTDEEWRAQLTKGCKLLSAIDTLDGDAEAYTSLIELCFGAIERSVEAYCLNMGGDALEDFQDHTYAYERADALGLFEQETADRLLDLYQSNRTDSYYGGRRPTKEQAAAMRELATAVHKCANDQLRNSGVCIC